jgi:tetraacyldisaccharide 4'-kinase
LFREESEILSKPSNRFLGTGNLVQRWADGDGPRGAGERVLGAALRVASGAWWVGASVRSAAFDMGMKQTRRVDCPVVSIGNLSVGGTGKSPMVIEAARILIESQRRVAIVSRGYRRQSGESVVVVSDGRGVLVSPGESGDEPALMAQAVPDAAVVVGADRYRAALKAIEIARPDVILLDDGFQHRALARDCDIVLWDALRPADASALLPRGLMREGLGALKRAHAIVFTRCNLGHSIRRILSRVKRIAPHLTVFRSNLEADGLIDPETGKLENLPHAADPLRGRRIAAWCGLGNPASFWRMLEILGAETLCRRAFDDHHRPSAADLAAFADEGARRGAEWVVTTEKDLQNLSERWSASLPLRVLRVRTSLGADTERFSRFLDGFLTRNGP